MTSDNNVCFLVSCFTVLHPRKQLLAVVQEWAGETWYRVPELPAPPDPFSESA
jgi:hypothetical protein